MSEREQLEQSMAALEAQRSLLGDAVVEAALGPMREKLAALEAQAQPIQQRKLATILFMDMVGHTNLVRGLDPEENLAIVDNALARLAQVIHQHGGQVVRFQGDGFKAVFGLPIAQEDDPERAVQAALGLQAEAAAIAGELAESRGLAGFNVRVGIDTGLVIHGGLTEGSEAVSGLTVNLASRLENAAEPGTILISHNSYRHVRGIFDVQPREPIDIKGFADPILTYVVLRAKPRAFRLNARGIEGIETRMIGRDYELGRLKDAYHDVTESSEARLVTVIGDAGVGKSRLLDEFSQWLELQPDYILYLKGRATPSLQSTPYGIFRDLFTYRFDILDSDSPEIALSKFRAGVNEVLDPDRADVLGHWLGFNFAASPAVGRLAGGSEFAAAAKAHLARYLRRQADDQPVVIFLEDIHWADDGSLDLILNLTEILSASRLLVIGATRPTLFERRAHWAEGHPAYSSLHLGPLSRRFTRVLIEEILQRATSVPEAVLETIVEDAEGIPFYVEELIKMLLDEGVIIRAADHWQIDTSRLGSLKVPPTLTGILQARLDSLPEEVRATIQRASVVGRLFWDAPVAHLTGTEPEAIHPILDSIRDREIVLRHEQSCFEGTVEYTFRHHLLREVAYETVLLKLRRLYHAQVANWLELNAGERLSEYLGLIAEHYLLAGRDDRAVEYFEQSGHQALQSGAYRAAQAAFQRALDLRTTASERSAIIAEDHIHLGEACWHLGEYETAQSLLTRGLEMAEQVGDKKAQATALGYLGRTADNQGDYQQARAYLMRALDLAREDDEELLSRTLYVMGGNAWLMGDLAAAESYAQDSLSIARRNSYKLHEGMATNLMGLIAGVRLDHDSEKAYYQRSLEISREIGDLFLEAVALANLGVAAFLQAQYEEAAGYLEAGLEIYRDLGRQDSISLNLGNLASAQIQLGDLRAARRNARESLRLAHQLRALPRILQGLQAWAELLLAEGQTVKGLTLIELTRSHPSGEFQLRQQADQMFDAVGADPADIEAALTAAAGLDVNDVLARILAGEEI